MEVESGNLLWFANQNSACKLRNQFTIERLTKHFQLDEE
ncbi:hypothetical protein PALA111701_08360 [Paenibacillus lactis]